MLTLSKEKGILTNSFEGKRHIKSLGGWSDVSLKEAREKAAAFKKDISEGIDPAKAEYDTPATFRDVSHEWASRFLPGLADIAWGIAA
ncbi:MAG: Arm DNA-binding domain-containing protein [Deltaproteobacteria bacterium]|nr:Arm DNA-binding domain-containing protein [Deltaproteobacteria bacterium]